MSNQFNVVRQLPVSGCNDLHFVDYVKCPCNDSHYSITTLLSSITRVMPCWCLHNSYSIDTFTRTMFGCCWCSWCLLCSMLTSRTNPFRGIMIVVMLLSSKHLFSFWPATVFPALANIVLLLILCNMPLKRYLI